MSKSQGRWTMQRTATLAAGMAVLTAVLMLALVWAAGRSPWSTTAATRTEVLAQKHAGSALWIQVEAPEVLVVGEPAVWRLSLRNDSPFDETQLSIAGLAGLEFLPSPDLGPGRPLTLAPLEARDLVLQVRALAEGEAVVYLQSITAGRSSIQGVATPAQSFWARMLRPTPPSTPNEVSGSAVPTGQDRIRSMPSLESR